MKTSYSKTDLLQGSHEYSQLSAADKRRQSNQVCDALINDRRHMLSDVQVLSMFLQAAGERSAESIARDTLKAVQGIHGLTDGNRELILSVPGMTRKRFSLILAARELSIRMTKSQLQDRMLVSSPDMVRDFLAEKFQGLQYEMFGVMFLDNRHRMIDFVEMFKGTIDTTSVYPREIIKKALSLNAAACLVAHNHPSGVAEPSDADVRLTRKLEESLSNVDVRLLDHCIFGQGTSTSLVERGLM